jgi:Mg-chelatase subunit ChlD
MDGLRSRTATLHRQYALPDIIRQTFWTTIGQLVLHFVSIPSTLSKYPLCLQIERVCQMPHIISEFAENPEPRCACVLLLDTSGSMSGPPIDALNDGLKAFEQDIKKDGIARKRVEIAIVTFGDQGVQKVQDFVTVDEFTAPHLSVGGSTPMAGAIKLGLDMIRDRKQEYNDAGILSFRPWIFMITDGGPL